MLLIAEKNHGISNENVMEFREKITNCKLKKDF